MTTGRSCVATLGDLRAQIAEHVARLVPGSRVVEVVPLAPDSGATAGIVKGAGYGQPVRLVLADPSGRRREVVWHTASANEFGHDRRADRVAGMVDAFDHFATTPRHTSAIDIGFIAGDGSLISVRDGGEAYLVSEFAAGSIYADDLRGIAARGSLRDLDRTRVDALAAYLAGLHVARDGGKVAYRRAIRDLVGHGEGIFGMIDAYPDDVPAAGRARLQAIEEHCVTWRHRLRGRHARLTRTHGDFHPFNIVFGDGAAFSLLDACRGGCGDPADDMTALAVNFLLFAIDREGAWQAGLGELWHRWWAGYAAARDDRELLDVVPPFLAWRTLVVCHPHFYPDLTPGGRDRLLGFAERVLDAGRLDPAWADAVFP